MEGRMGGRKEGRERGRKRQIPDSSVNRWLKLANAEISYTTIYHNSLIPENQNKGDTFLNYF